jgi:hypothetical protein
MIVVITGGVFGARWGLVRVLSRFIVFIGAALLTRWQAPNVAVFIAEHTDLNETISDWIAKTTRLERWNAEFQSVTEQSVMSTLVDSEKLSTLQQLLDPQTGIAMVGANYILLWMTYILMFFLVIYLLKFGFRLLDLTLLQIPGIKQANRFGGWIVGTVAATLIATLLTVIWIPISSSTAWGSQPRINSDQSWFATDAIHTIGLDQHTMLRAASDWLLPMILDRFNGVENE